MTTLAITHEQASLVARSQPVSIIHNKDGLFVVMTETGEIVNQQLTYTSGCKIYSRSINKYVGIDTRFPSESRDAEEVLEAVSVHDPFVRNLSVNYAGLLDLLEYSLNATELQMFRYICSNLTAWNYWYGSHQDLANQFPKLSKSSRYAILQKLQQGLIQVVSTGGRSGLIVQVHPWYAFRGAWYIQDGLLEQWGQRQAIAARRAGQGAAA